MVMISERSPEVEDRSVTGHWERDLILGEFGRSGAGALVERSTRDVMVLHLPDGREAAKVNEATRKVMLSLPEELRRSLTCDQVRKCRSTRRSPSTEP
jgi:IS30 family transposase